MRSGAAEGVLCACVHACVMSCTHARMHLVPDKEDTRERLLLWRGQERERERERRERTRARERASERARDYTVASRFLRLRLILAMVFFCQPYSIQIGGNGTTWKGSLQLPPPRSGVCAPCSIEWCFGCCR